jgi:hypothetical protein
MEAESAGGLFEVAEIINLADFDSRDLVFFGDSLSLAQDIVKDHSLSRQGIRADDVTDGQKKDECKYQSQEVIEGLKFFGRV